MNKQTNNSARPEGLTDIESAAKLLREQRDKLSDTLSELTDQIEALKRKHLPAIKRCVAYSADAQAHLANIIDGARELFTSPRTHIFHGIKCGLKKGGGKILITDEQRTIELIEKHLPAQAEVLIKTEKSPRKKAIDALDVADLKKIGCTVEGTVDRILIHDTASDIEKAVNALLKDATEEATEQAA